MLTHVIFFLTRVRKLPTHVRRSMTSVDLKAQISEAKKVVKLALEPVRWKQFGIT